MGMFEGMIIGAVVGLVVAGVTLLRKKGARNELLRILAQQGPAAARAYLDRKTPARDRLGVSHLQDQRERMAALGLLGDVEALEREIAVHQGALNVTGQVDAVGLICIALRAPSPADAAARLEALSARFDREGGRLYGLVKKQLRHLAILGRAMTGQAVPLIEARPTLDGIASGGGMLQLVMWQALARALSAHGPNAASEELRRKVLAVTTAFEQPPAGRAAG